MWQVPHICKLKNKNPNLSHITRWVFLSSSWDAPLQAVITLVWLKWIISLNLQRDYLILDLSAKSPFVSLAISSAFTPYPLFQWYPQSKEILLNLGMKCWNSALNAQGSRVIIVLIVLVQVGALIIYVAAV
jgi:hypothetical protein